MAALTEGDFVEVEEDDLDAALDDLAVNGAR
jgi:hypothetical protein